jgi:hypothetical protein
MLSIPFNFKAEELGFRSLGSAVDYLQTPFARLAAAVAKIRTNPGQGKTDDPGDAQGNGIY